jgi:hypothetical protein
VVSSDAPQFAQNRPLPGVEQAGQTVCEVEGCVMRYKLTAKSVVALLFGHEA